MESPTFLALRAAIRSLIRVYHRQNDECLKPEDLMYLENTRVTAMCVGWACSNPSYEKAKDITDHFLSIGL